MALHFTEEEFWEIRLPQINTRAADISFILDKIKTKDILIITLIDPNTLLTLPIIWLGTWLNKYVVLNILTPALVNPNNIITKKKR